MYASEISPRAIVETVIPTQNRKPRKSRPRIPSREKKRISGFSRTNSTTDPVGLPWVARPTRVRNAVTLHTTRSCTPGISPIVGPSAITRVRSSGRYCTPKQKYALIVPSAKFYIDTATRKNLHGYEGATLPGCSYGPHRCQDGPRDRELIRSSFQEDDGSPEVLFENGLTLDLI